MYAPHLFVLLVMFLEEQEFLLKVFEICMYLARHSNPFYWVENLEKDFANGFIHSAKVADNFYL